MDCSQLELIFNFKSIIEKECPEFKFHDKLIIGSYNKYKRLKKIKMKNYYNYLKILARCKCKECNFYKKTDTNKFIPIIKFQVEGYENNLIPLIDMYNEVIKKNDYENFDINKIDDILNIIDLHFQETNFDLVKKHNVIIFKNKLGAKAQLIIGLLIKINNSIYYLFTNLYNDDNDDDQKVKNKKTVTIIKKYTDKINFIINEINSRKLSNVLITLKNS